VNESVAEFPLTLVTERSFTVPGLVVGEDTATTERPVIGVSSAVAATSYIPGDDAAV
jgi:hypothetical protein